MMFKKSKIKLGERQDIHKPKERIQALESENKKLRKEIKKLKSIEKKLEKENKNLKKKLNLSSLSPSCPSGAKPGFVKTETSETNKGKKKPGRNNGHKGITRKGPTEEEITGTVEEKLDNCPDCGKKLQSAKSQGNKTPPQRKKIIININ